MSRIEKPVERCVRKCVDTSVDQHSCLLLATHALDAGQLAAQAVLDGSKGQAQAERGFRFLKDPQFLAPSLSQKA